MKGLTIISLIVAIASSVSAQPGGERDKELSLSASYQNISGSGSNGSSGLILISPRIGFFFAKGFEIEPELLLLLSPGSDAIYMLSGNLSYNVLSAGRSVPFFLAGYGIANTIPLFNVPFLRTPFIGVLNLGAGVKAFLSEDIAIRVEYRFQNFVGSDLYGTPPYTYTENIDVQMHTVHIGITVLL